MIPLPLIAIVLTTLLASTDPPALLIKKPWTPIDGVMDVSTWPQFAQGEVILLAHDGTRLAEAVTFVDRHLDAVEAFPAIQTLDRAAYLQLLVDGQPVGQPLVIVPALSRLVPLTQEMNAPDGTPERGTWTTIIGWQDEGALDNGDLPEGSGRFEGAARLPGAGRDEAVVRSGWWIRPEQDVLIETTMGDLQVDLREDAAPMTARNFQMLVEDRYYDNTIMHRILLQGRNGRPFVIQGGDPTGSGSGGPGWWVPLEPSTLPHHFGVLSMARGDDPDSGGSQWFIALDRSETARLDGLYCAFGDVVTGADTLEALARVPIADSDYLSSRPVDPPAITRARLIPAPPRTPQSGRPDARVTPPTTSPWAAAAPPRR